MVMGWEADITSSRSYPMVTLVLYCKRVGQLCSLNSDTCLLALFSHYLLYRFTTFMKLHAAQHTPECVPIENVGVQPSVHAFPWAPCAEWSTSSHHHVENTNWYEVRILVRKSFQANHHMSQLWQPRHSGMHGNCTLLLHDNICVITAVPSFQVQSKWALNPAPVCSFVFHTFHMDLSGERPAVNYPS